MNKQNLLLTIANKSKLIVESTFKGYDLCLNPYVGCQFGCKYCYVRFFIKDKKAEWGDFVRRREHIITKLPGELAKIDSGSRLVLGTMTDPYQPEERKHRLTRSALTSILQMSKPFDKVGIFTRSPIVIDDINLISRLPKARVHFSVTPFTQNVMAKIELIPIHTKARWNTIRKLKEAGIRVHVNVAPAIPIVSDPLITEYCETMANIGVDEFFVDPMQTYSESYDALKGSMIDDSNWSAIDHIMTDKVRFKLWKDQYRDAWISEWKKVGDPSKTLAIWCDHVHKVWIDMITGKNLNPRNYGT